MGFASLCTKLALWLKFCKKARTLVCIPKSGEYLTPNLQSWLKSIMSCDRMTQCRTLSAVFLAAICLCKNGFGATLNIPDTPLFISGSKTALVQLVMQRDNNLFYEAYPSYEDINGDGVLDTTFKPDEIDYYGYFDSNFCYENVSGTYLEAVSEAVDKTCTNAWSGDYLNYLSMTRMDTLLRVLYGGKREVDTIDQTILRRAFVPWENHTWGIEYNSIAIDGYDISDYSPLAQPAVGKRHLLSTSNYLRNDEPYLRVRLNSEENIWQWVDKAETQGDGPADLNIILDVLVCKDGFLEASCQQYPEENYKPVGLLHEYGENDSMYFSLITGSFEHNLRGGVLRQSMGSFGSKEVIPDNGIFTGAPGIVKTLDAIQIPNAYQPNGRTVHDDCDWIFDRAMENGECRAWGNPVAEMMYEGMRYFAGLESPTPEFETSDDPDVACKFDDGTEIPCDEGLGLSKVEWDDPYSGNQPYGQCSSAYQLVISDPSPSFDGDQLPGSYFAEFSSTTLGNLHVGELADTISENEPGATGLKFIGQVGELADGTPSPKQVDTFRNIRGQAPQAPHREGSYYAPSVAYYGHTNDLHTADGDQSVGNFTLALGSPLPSIEVEVGDNKVVFAPIGKTVEFCGNDSDYFPTNAIVGFNVESHSPTSGSFRVSFEDMEQGADNDMDAIARYSYSVVGGQVVMEVSSIEAAGCGKQHLGYTVSGTTQDGVYLVVRDKDTGAAEDLDYELDVPPGAELPLPGVAVIAGSEIWNDGVELPLVSTRTFTVSDESPAEQLPSPLWYAAKWGGFDDANGDGIPQTSEWDSNGDGDPDNFFENTNPSMLAQTMRGVFNKISEETGAATAVTASTGSLNTGDRIYRSQFVSGLWTGDVIAQSIDSSGTIDPIPVWNASDALAEKLADGDEREIITYDHSSGVGVPFRWPADILDDGVSPLQQIMLRRNPVSGTLDSLGEDRLNYIRGETIDGFRTRSSPLGDVINSSSVLVAAPNGFYPDYWGVDAPENDEPYSDFRRENSDRRRMVYVGANDGMLHGFSAGVWDGTTWTEENGDEVFAYIPSQVFPRLPALTDSSYGHKYFVDATPRAADVFINDEWRTVLIGTLGQGGQGIYALDITDPDEVTEANAEDAVLWEVTDNDIARIGFIHSSPVITRMANGKWMAIVGNGYNNSLPGEGYRQGNGNSGLVIIDIETGNVTRLLSPDPTATNCDGTRVTPNAMAEPTGIDFDGDNVIESIYVGDLFGCVYHFDVSSDDPSLWTTGEVIHRAVDDNGNRQAITSAVSVGSHPSGDGVLVYFGTGKYLEPGDQRSKKSNRLYAVWDRANSDTESLTRIAAGNMLQQSIVLEETVGFDIDGDGVDDDYIETRTTSDEPINWDEHEGWYMNLEYLTAMGEQILSAPVLRDGKIVVSTHIPSGDECTPGQDGWLMVLNAVNGGMIDPGVIDLDGDGRFNDSSVSGIRNKVNPFSSPTVVASPASDIIISQSETDPEPSTRSLASSFADGRLTWRELQP